MWPHHGHDLEVKVKMMELNSSCLLATHSSFKKLKYDISLIVLEILTAACTCCFNRCTHRWIFQHVIRLLHLHVFHSQKIQRSQENIIFPTFLRWLVKKQQYMYDIHQMMQDETAIFQLKGRVSYSMILISIRLIHSHSTVAIIHIRMARGWRT